MKFVDETISYLRDMMWLYPRNSPAIPKPCWRLLGIAALCDAVALVLVTRESLGANALSFEIPIAFGCAAGLLATSGSVIEIVRSACRARPDRAPLGWRITFHTYAMLAALVGLGFAAGVVDVSMRTGS